MDPRVIDEVLASRAKLRIADALTVRPRTLNELASITGITVQGVIRHLRRLSELGLVEEKRLPVKNLKARTLYAARAQLIGDYSTSDLTVVKPTEAIPSRPGEDKAQELERMAAEVLVLRRRVRDEARRLGGMIDDLVDEQKAVNEELEALDLKDEERLIVNVIVTEETLEEGLRVLSRYYGIDDRRSIDRALAKAKRSGGK